MKVLDSSVIDFEQLYGEIRSCEKCLLHKTRTNAVPGEGPYDAEVMFIGEAPGVNEDRLGRPFVGRAGSFLEELILAAGFTRSEVYICNVLKCRPPENRDPLPMELEACNDFVERQISAIDPAVIVTLGRYSMRRFFPDGMISRIHGQPKMIEDRLIVPMYHPAAALHRANLKEIILSDFALLPQFIEQVYSLKEVNRSSNKPESSHDYQANQLDLFDH